MKPLEKERASKGEKTMLTSLLLSAPGPIVTGIPAITSRSATQMADFLRRTAELVALFIAWWVYRKLQRKQVVDEAAGLRMEKTAQFAVVGAMFSSGLAMLVVGISRFFVYQANGKVTMGLIIALLGLLTNGWFWRRYRRMVQEAYDPVLEGQQKLYRAKTCVDLGVTIALISVAVMPSHPVTQIIDAVGCLVVAGYLLYNGWEMLKKQGQQKGEKPEA